MSKYHTVSPVKFDHEVPAKFQAHAEGYNKAISLDSGDEFLGGMEWAGLSYGKKTVEYDFYVLGYIQGIDARFPNGTVPCDYNHVTNTYTIK
jgi:hypothetical protein